MARNRSTSEIARDRRRIGALYLQGWLQAEIVQETGLSQSTISRDLISLHAIWLKDSVADVGKRRAGELAKIDALEIVNWEAWLNSKKDQETIVRKSKGTVTRQKGNDGKFASVEPAEVTRTTKGQAGNPRFLEGVQWCIDRRIKILGLDAPARLDIAQVTDIRITEVVVEVPSSDIIEGEVVKNPRLEDKKHEQ